MQGLTSYNKLNRINQVRFILVMGLFLGQFLIASFL